MKTKSEVARMYINGMTARKRDLNDPDWREDLITAVYVHGCNDYPDHEPRERIAAIVDSEIATANQLRRIVTSKQRRAA